MEKTYIYNRKDGGTTYCYGQVEEDSNFAITCEDEYNDGVWTDNGSCKSWSEVCKYLEENYDSKIEELTAV